VKVSSSVALVPVAKATAATVIMGLCLLILPFVQPVVTPFLVLPAVHVVASRGPVSGAIVAVVSGGLLYVVGGVSSALLAFLLVLCMGAALGQALRRRWDFTRSLATTAGAALFAFVAWGMALWLVLGVNLTDLRESAYASIEETAALYVQMGVGTATADSVSDLLRRFVDIVPYLAPGLLGMGAILLAGCSMGLAYLLFPRLREKVTVDLSLSRFRMHWAVAYASIAGLAMLLFARGDGDWQAAVLYVGINILLVSQTLFFVQGMAVLRWFVVSRHMRPGSWAALFVAAIVGQVLVHLTALAGLFDTWFDYRKRFALKSPGAGPLG
jgi:uncharacterized protein YybS (DUF2232 family)